MKNLTEQLIQRKKKLYLKKKERFLKTLQSREFFRKSARSKYKAVEKLKSLEKDLGLKSSVNYRHWALALTLGIISIIPAKSQNNPFKLQKDGKVYEHTTNFDPSKISKSLIDTSDDNGGLSTMATTNTSWRIGDFLGDPFVGGVVPGDIDGDGDEDIILLNYENNLDFRVFLNDGSGNLSLGSPIVVNATNTYYYGGNLVDIDNDGDLDFITTANLYVNPNSYEYIIPFTNDGTGNFTQGPAINSAVNQNLGQFLPLDFDSDGDIDIVTSKYNDSYFTDSLIYFTNDGLGNFTFAQTDFFSTSQLDLADRRTSLADFDNDGDIDILAFPTYSQLVYPYGFYPVATVYLNDGFQSFKNRNDSITTGLPGLPTSPRPFAVGAIDNDSDIDFVINDPGYSPIYNDTLRFFANNGDGTFANELVVNTASGYTFSRNADTVDIDNDGDLDFIVERRFGYLSGGDSLSIIRNDGTSFAFVQSFNNGSLSVYNPSVIDIDGDGDSDFTAGNSLEQFIFTNNAGSFSQTSEIPLNPVYWFNAIPVDVNNDGNLDLLASGTTQILLNDGFGGFTIDQEFWRTEGVSTGLDTLDLEGDGDFDIIYKGNYGDPNINILTNDGSGNFTPGLLLSTTGFEIEHIVAGDLDEDLDTDFILVGDSLSSTGSAKIVPYFNDGAGNFNIGTVSSFSSINRVSALPKLVDFDGDGDLDFISARNSYLLYALNDSTGNFTTFSVASSNVNYNFEGFTLIDNDGDTDLDVILANNNYSAAIVFNNNFISPGTNNFLQAGGQIVMSYITSQSSVINGDFDNDGDQDLVFGSYYGTTEVQLRVTGFVSDGTIEASLFNMATADLDNDGDLDIFGSQYSTAGRVIFNELVATSEAPIVNDSTFSLAENSIAGTIVGTVGATDPQAEPVTFNISGGNTGAAFAINASSGVISVATPSSIDFETNDIFNLTVTGSDGTNSSTGTITINVTNVNEAPAIDSASFNVMESAAVNDLVGIVTATDPEGDAISYTISAGNTNGAFTINDTTGAILVADPTQLDSASIPQYALSILASDGVLDSVQQITINVLQGYAPPSIADQTFEVPENSSVGTVIDTVLVTNPDGDGLSFSILSGNELGIFAINDSLGVLSVSDSLVLDHEFQSTYPLEVRVEDSQQADTATVTVNVLNVNERPELTPNSFSIEENLADGEIIGSMSASDPDLSDTLTYMIGAGNINSTFALNDSTGEISVANSTVLDFETNPSFSLTIFVTDVEGLQDSTVVPVTLLDVNEAPVAASQSFPLPENPNVGQEVGTFTATDPEGNNISYQVTSGNENNTFAVDSTSGLITVVDSAGIDFEINTSFTLLIESSDGLLTTTDTLTVNVQDVNESPQGRNQRFFVDLDAGIGTELGTVTASDPENDTLIYSITEGNSELIFAIDPASGIITLLQQGALVTGSAYNLTVQVTDGVNIFEKTVTIRVTTLERDGQALIELNDALDLGQDTWVGTPDADWENIGLTANAGRVDSLNIEGVGGTGAIPESFVDLSGLTYINLSGNNITSIPEITDFPNLETLLVDGNQLSTGELTKNLGITTYSYADQQPIDVLAKSQEVAAIEAGTSFTFTATAFDPQDQFIWYLKTDSTGSVRTAVTETTSSNTYNIASIDFNSMGEYSVDVVNNQLGADFVLNSTVEGIRAFTDITGLISADNQGALLTEGEVELYKVGDGPFRGIDTVSIASVGSYLFSEIVLGDYQLIVDPGESFPDVLKTYYRSTDDWVRADILRLREAADSININMIFNPGDDIAAATGEEGIAFAEGQVETNFAEDGEGRVEARRRVRKAGCSLRRRSRGGRTDQDPNYGDPASYDQLIAYTETDENGEFSFSNIPADTFLINIQYPGVPMDESSNLFFVVEDDGTEGGGFDIAATITEDGIEVIVEEVLGTLKPYIKDAVLYPNPTKGMLKLDYLVYRKMDALNAELLDLNGKVVLEKELNNQLGNQQMQMDMSELESGIYLLRLKNDDDEFTFSFRIIKE